jgi:hypothetical protein
MLNELLALDEDEHPARPHPVGRHRLGRGLRSERVLESVKVGGLNDQAHPMRLNLLDKGSRRDAERSEDLLPIGRRQPVVDVIYFVNYENRYHAMPQPSSSFSRRSFL